MTVLQSCFEKQYILAVFIAFIRTVGCVDLLVVAYIRQQVFLPLAQNMFVSFYGH